MQLELGGAGGTASWTDLSDAEFLRSISWKRGTATELTAAAKKGDQSAFIAALATNGLPANESDIAAGSIPCRAIWSLPAFEVTPREQDLATVLSAAPASAPKQSKAKKSSAAKPVDALEAWWEQADFQRAPLTMWEYLALLEAFPRRMARLTIPTAFSIWRTLLTVACDLTQLAPVLDAKKNSDASKAELARYGFLADSFLDLSLLRNCELPWLAGVLFSSIKGSEKLLKAGADLLEHELVERTDDQGAPHADLLPRLPFWLAVATRILETAERQQITLWDADAVELYRALIEKIAPLIRPDGRLALSHVQVPEPRAFAEEVLKTSGWSETEAALRTLFTLPKRGVKRTGSSKIASAPPPPTPRRNPLEICIAPTNQSDDAAWSVMRTHWGAHADRVTVTHDQPAMNIELTVQGQPVLEGEWSSALTVGKDTTPFRGEWICVCWQTDQDADYIEMQLFIRGVVRAERQILLSRSKQFCLIAEALGDLKSDQFTYRTKLPLASGVTGTTGEMTREVRLEAGGVPVRVFPVALPDQHVFSTPGRFTSDLSFETTARGSAWYNPVLIDWSPARRSANAIWKSLTVAEEQKIVKPDIAAGHRIKVGNHQWLIYRSLRQSIEARSVLGHQTRFETVIGSVENNGDITPLMLVE